MSRALPSLFAISDVGGVSVERHLERAAALHASLGARLGLVVRERQMPARDLMRLIAGLRTAAPLATLLVAGRADVAALTADGVHLGERDLPVGEARRIVGGKLVTRAAHADTPEDELSRADALFVSPIFATPGKGVPRGAEALRAGRRFGIPLVALGGIGADEVAPCFEAGAAAVAVRRAWLRADACSGLVRAVEAASRTSC